MWGPGISTTDSALSKVYFFGKVTGDEVIVVELVPFGRLNLAAFLREGTAGVVFVEAVLIAKPDDLPRPFRTGARPETGSGL